MILDRKIKYHNFQGVKMISEFLDGRFRGSEVLVYFDPDVDGVISGRMACCALSMKKIGFSWYINTNRGHGFLLDTNMVRGKKILCVDFQIPYEKLKELVDAGCDILSFDHHENGENFIEYDNGVNKGIIINNQFSDEDDDGRYLSGAGVVFESFVGYFGDDFDTRENRSLVGLTLLTDIRDIENINARLYLQELYNHPYKGYIKYLIENTLGEADYGYGVPRMDRNYVDYVFSPVINSCLRFNREDMVVKFILGSGYINLEFHDMQKKLVASMMKYSKVVKMNNLNVVIIDTKPYKGMMEYNYLSNFVGLIASQFLDGSRSAIAYLVDGKEVGRASFRGRVNGLDYLSRIEKIIDGVGHGSAFGIRSLKPSKSLFVKVDNICKEMEESEDFSVDYINTQNFSMVANSKGYTIGVENIYCLSQHRRYIRYTGNNIKTRKKSNTFQEYDIDGFSVKCFDENLNPKGDLIMPIIERGVLCYYLNKEYKEYKETDNGNH